MQDYQKRVIEEKNVLDGKIERLKAFFSSDIYLSLREENQQLFQEQLEFMVGYTDILAKRIQQF